MNINKFYIFFLFVVISCVNNHSLTPNYNETSVKPYILPDNLSYSNGEKICSPKEWEQTKRKEIITHYTKDIYGSLPHSTLEPIAITLVEQNNSVLNDIAIRKQINIKFVKNNRNLDVNILVYLPKKIKSPHVFIAYNFYGNHTIIKDTSIVLTNSWLKNNKELGIIKNYATEKSRGKRNYRWPLEKMIKNGFGLATVYYGDIDPDRDNFTDGVHPLFYKPNQQEPLSHEWGSISAWAWGSSRVLDYLKKDLHTKDSKFILFGHSRLAKTALWAGALDDRFDIVIANNSGCGGAALFRRKYGETISIINNKYPHWFSKNFKKYNDKEELLPVDQHMLISLIAPRPVYIASATNDLWADPKGEYLSAYYATLVYELYEKKGLVNSKLPKHNKPIHQNIGYHIRKGKHDVTNYDWIQFMTFASIHLN